MDKIANKIVVSALIIVAVFALIFTPINVFAASDNSPELRFSFGDVRQGDEFTGTLYFTKNSNVSRMAITLKYDTKIVDFISCNTNEDALVDTVINTENTGEIKLSFVSTKNCNFALYKKKEVTIFWCCRIPETAYPD